MITKEKKAKGEVIEQKSIDNWEWKWAKIFMFHTSQNSNFSFSDGSLFKSLMEGNTPVGERFLEPLKEIIPQLKSVRRCEDLPDADWLTLGILRVLHEVKSGRGFLQEVAAYLPNCPDVSQFFATLRSERRGRVCQEAESLLSIALKRVLPDSLGAEKELEGFDIYAGDGHWHGAAAHDKAPFAGSAKSSVGHFFALDLRYGLLHHITAADQIEREHEHDMRALKRQSCAALRRGAAKGHKVLYVWDKAGIDFQAWEGWKRSSGIYFLSQEKENMALESLGALDWELSEARNAGIENDERCRSASGVILRRIVYQDPLSERIYVFITNEMTLPPGILAELARRRWNIEKVFDEFKNKFSETKAWATTATAKSMQALFFCLTYQLLIAFEHLLETQHGIRPEGELKRRATRIAQDLCFAAKNNRPFPRLRAATLRLTQHTVKLLRWLRASFSRQAPWLDLIAILSCSYAST